MGCLGVDAGAECHGFADHRVVHQHDARPEVSAVSEAADIRGTEKAAALVAVQRSRRPPRASTDHPGSLKVMTRDHLFVMNDPTVSAVALLYTCRRRHEYGTKVLLPTRQHDEDAAHHEDGPLRPKLGGARTADIGIRASAATGDDGLRSAPSPPPWSCV